MDNGEETPINVFKVPLHLVPQPVAFGTRSTPSLSTTQSSLPTVARPCAGFPLGVVNIVAVACVAKVTRTTVALAVILTYKFPSPPIVIAPGRCPPSVAARLKG